LLDSREFRGKQQSARRLNGPLSFFTHQAWISVAFELARSGKHIVCENGSEPPCLILIMQQHDGNDAEILFAAVALRYFALQILQEAVSETIKSALAASSFLIPLPAVGTKKFDGVLLRIAVQSCPAGAAHPDGFGIMPFHQKPSVTFFGHRELDPRP
jgi:hypothetical protein